MEKVKTQEDFTTERRESCTQADLSGVRDQGFTSAEAAGWHLPALVLPI